MLRYWLLNDEYLHSLTIIVLVIMFFYAFNSLQLGGLNSFLAIERSTMIPVVSKSPTIIVGMDVSHGSPGQSDIPSIAAVMSILSCVSENVIFILDD